MTRYQTLAATTVLATLVLIAIGAVVRTTGSGLGCPDWPLCHGGLLPPFERIAIIEYTHRTAASIVGLLIVWVAVWTLRRYRHDPALAGLAVASLPLLAVQAWLGKETVERELPPEVVTLHLATGLVLFAVVALIAALAWLGPARRRLQDPDRERFLRVATIGTAITFAVLIAGSYLVGEGAGPACSSWPGCTEAPTPFFDGERLQHVHWLHRATVVIGALSVVAVAWSSTWVERAGPTLRRGIGLLTALYAAQIIVGAANIWTDHSAVVRSAHLALAAAIWALLVTTVVAARFAPGPVEEAAPAPRTTPASGGAPGATTGEGARV